MKLYPAIDLRGGQAVRLYQGDYDQMTVYNADPAAQAREFIAAGAKYLHVVDLDGAKDDTTANMTTIAAIAKQGGLFIEVGGGIRDEARIEQYLSLGVGRCILGTIAVKDFDFTARMAQKYGPKIAVGVDMRDGLVAVNGWKEVTPEPGIAFCRRCAEAGVQAIIATDISRDGTMQGTNMDLYRELLQISGLEITASGGIARMEELAELQAMGCHAAILGKSIYTGAESCFFNPVYVSDELKQFTWQGLYELIEGRKTNPKEGSYTTYLFDKGLEKILKKVGEESTEVIIAGSKRDKEETVYEISDLAYHVMVLMIELGISVEDITKELEKRHVIDHKVKQERMQ